MEDQGLKKYFLLTPPNSAEWGAIKPALTWLMDKPEMLNILEALHQKIGKPITLRIDPNFEPDFLVCADEDKHEIVMAPDLLALMPPYPTASGEEHPVSLERIFVHELFHFIHEEDDNDKAAESLSEILYDHEPEFELENHKNIINTARSRKELHEILGRLYDEHVASRVPACQEAAWTEIQRHPEILEYWLKQEREIIEFENTIMEKYSGEPPRDIRYNRIESKYSRNSFIADQTDWAEISTNFNLAYSRSDYRRDR